jgi:hypothetical protein
MKIRFQNVKTQFPEYAKDRGFYFLKTQGLFTKFTTEKVSSNLDPRSKIGWLRFTSNATVRKPTLLPRFRPANAMADAKAHRKTSAPPSPTTIQSATNSNRKRNQTRTVLSGFGELRRPEEGTRQGEGGGAIAGASKLTKNLDSKHYKPKEEHGEGEEKTTSSPARRIRPPNHPKAPRPDVRRIQPTPTLERDDLRWNSRF